MDEIYNCKPLQPSPEWAEYVRRKEQWVAANPGASCAAYDAAIRAILDEMGI